MKLRMLSILSTVIVISIVEGYTVEEDVNYLGSDIVGGPFQDTIANCSVRCGSTLGCLGFVNTAGTCYLKSSMLVSSKRTGQASYLSYKRGKDS